MTLVAALSGREGTILFADTQETVGNYGIKKIDKLASWDCKAFRLGIAGASDEGTYSDMLQLEILSGVSSLAEFDEGQIITRLGEILTGFYSKHIWPRTGEKPQIEYILVVQPMPGGPPMVLHIAETAVNIVPEDNKTIGVGTYLADYLLNVLRFEIAGAEGMGNLCGLGVYIAKEVRENVEGIGSLDRIAMFRSDGSYDELSPSDILEIEENVGSFHEFLPYFFVSGLDVSLTESDPKPITDFARHLEDMRQRQVAWWNKHEDGRESRSKFRDLARERASGA